jgi:hypothetical protein
MRRTKGMFDGFHELEHSIPNDDFEHVKSMECACEPYTRFVSGVGAAICHRAVYLEHMADDYFPEEWVGE